MAVQMLAGEIDDPGFIEAVNSIVRESIADHEPEQFWVIQVVVIQTVNLCAKCSLAKRS
jgi:hypothetical protein